MASNRLGRILVLSTRTSARPLWHSDGTEHVCIALPGSVSVRAIQARATNTHHRLLGSVSESKCSGTHVRGACLTDARRLHTWLPRRMSSESNGAGTTSATETHFGFQTVRTEDKAKLVGEVFSAVASKYDIMNDFMSGGLHRVWKDELVAALGPQRGMTIVDLAGGTGDVTFRIVDALRAQGAQGHVAAGASRVIVCDINAEMLQEGRKRAKERGYASGDTWLHGGGVDTAAPKGDMRGDIAVEFLRGDAECLPFEDASVDALTIAFGLRNVTHTLPALKEIKRVLKRGGRFMCMEFSRVQDPILSQMYDMYSFNVIPPVGAAVAGDGQPYQYLVESIRKWHDQQTLASLMRDAGMREVSYKNILNGVVAVHSGFRLD